MLDKTTKALRRGICYDELTDEQKEAFEDTFADQEQATDETDFTGTIINA